MDSIAFFDKLEGFMQSKFGEKEPRECPECAKCSDASMPKYFASLGSLKQHLLEHYRVKYYLENVREWPCLSESSDLNYFSALSEN